MIEIHLLGFNIFNIGGTSQANINLLNEFVESDQLTYYNQIAFSKATVNQFKAEHPTLEAVDFQPLSTLYHCQRDENYQGVFLISRETLFPMAEILRRTYPKAMIIGGIHAPLATIDDEIAEFLPYFNSIRVTTESVKTAFIKRFHFDRVFALHVSTRHLLDYRPIQTEATTNFTILTRFDEQTKNISYALKLWDYLVHTCQLAYKLYITGQGQAERLYQTLINYYDLKDYVFINQPLPLTSIYLSTSRYETFGYSICEALLHNQPVCLTKGEDGVVGENFAEMAQVFWLSGKVKDDVKQLTAASQLTPELVAYAHNRQLLLQHVGSFFVGLEREMKVPFSFPQNLTKHLSEAKRNQLIDLLIDKYESNVFLWFRNIYTRMKVFPVLGKIVMNSKIRQLGMRLADFFTKVVPDEKLHDNWYFIESFHGSNFSSDPKYLALAIKEADPTAEIFVSSVNSLVDVEIWNAGLESVRLGSSHYLTIYSQCKTVIVNGNTLDKAGKLRDQIIIQTWHGFPLKKMVNDLENTRQRKTETTAFIPRMKKWDFLISSSTFQTTLLSSAFQLSENPRLKILTDGAPRNEYLLEHQNDEIERQRIFEYLLNRPYDTNLHFILFCPTWRKNNRKNISNIDLKELMTLLPSNYELIVKLHPNESSLRKYYAKLDPRIHCFFNESVDIQELYLLCDLLISDYSSAMFDFAHTGKKMICLQEDTNAYEAKIGFYFDLATYGFKAANYDTTALAKEILNPETTINTKMITQQLLTEDSLQSSQKILKAIKKAQSKS